MADIASRLALKLDDDDDEPDAPPAPDTPEVPEPPGPAPSEPGDNRTLSSPINELEHRLFNQRKVLIFGAINDKLARDVTGQLLALSGQSDAPIDVYINSPGGHVESGDTIHDMISSSTRSRRCGSSAPAGWRAPAR